MSQTDLNQKYGELVSQCDQMIKAGKISQAQELIRTVNMAKIPRRWRLGMAKVCRRAGLINHGLRILHAVVRDNDLKVDDASDAEKSEYSVLLVRNGSMTEALSLLETVDESNSPEALMYKAFCHIALWEYQEAVEFLEKFMSSNADPYMKSVGQVNLASSLIVVSRLDEAAKLLQEVQIAVEKSGATRLVGNCHELWGQLHFWKNDFQSSRKSLAKALEIFGASPSYDRLLIDKTEAIMSSLETKSLEPLNHFRKAAVASKHWESVREADLFSLKVHFDQERLDHLIFGTPLISYRQRIQEIVGAKPRDVYVWGSKESPCLDLRNGWIDGAIPLSPGKKIHHAIASLARDFYSPRNLGGLFSELYPGEYFDTLSSPGRIRQIMKRTRQWLLDHEIPVQILQDSGSYHLAIEGSFGIKMALEDMQIDSMELKWKLLRTTYEINSRFTADQVCQKFSWSRTGFRRFADWAFERKLLKKSGTGRATVYELNVEKKERAAS